MKGLSREQQVAFDAHVARQDDEWAQRHLDATSLETIRLAIAHLRRNRLVAPHMADTDKPSPEWKRMVRALVSITVEDAEKGRISLAEPVTLSESEDRPLSFAEQADLLREAYLAKRVKHQNREVVASHAASDTREVRCLPFGEGGPGACSS